MSFYNVRDAFGRFTKSDKSNKKTTTTKKTKLKSVDYLLLDASSSMSDKVPMLIQSYNECMDMLNNSSNLVDLESYTLKFDSYVGPLSRNNSFNHISSFKIGGMTALFDALGTAINHAIQNYVKGQQTVITVVTDGIENASNRYNLSSIKELVETAKNKYNITINYIGAGDFLSVQAAAQSMGIFASNTINIDNSGRGISQGLDKYKMSRLGSTQSFASTGETHNYGFFSNE
jgi:hypothetical protein